MGCDIHIVVEVKKNGKWEYVRAHKRRNPDDIINNNLSYKGNEPYDGTNPIRNQRRQ